MSVNRGGPSVVSPAATELGVVERPETLAEFGQILRIRSTTIHFAIEAIPRMVETVGQRADVLLRLMRNDSRSNAEPEEETALVHRRFLSSGIASPESPPSFEPPYKIL